MIIIAGHLTVDPADRDAYLSAVAGVNALSRAREGCLDFVQVADPLEHDRIVIFERWTDDDALIAFRSSGVPEGQDPLVPPRILGADVSKYRIAGVEAP